MYVHTIHYFDNNFVTMCTFTYTYVQLYVPGLSKITVLCLLLICKVFILSIENDWDTSAETSTATYVNERSLLFCASSNAQENNIRI